MRVAGTIGHQPNKGTKQMSMKFRDFAILTAEIADCADPLAKLDEKISQMEDALSKMRSFRKTVATMLGKHIAPGPKAKNGSGASSESARMELVKFAKQHGTITPNQAVGIVKMSMFTVHSYLQHQWFKKESRGVYSLSKEGQTIAAGLSTKDLLTNKPS